MSLSKVPFIFISIGVEGPSPNSLNGDWTLRSSVPVVEENSDNELESWLAVSGSKLTPLRFSRSSEVTGFIMRVVSSRGGGCDGGGRVAVFIRLLGDERRREPMVRLMLFILNLFLQGTRRG